MITLGVYYMVGFWLAWYMCSRRVPKFKTGTKVCHKHSRSQVGIVQHLKSDYISGRWIYYVIWDKEGDGYYSAASLTKCTRKP